VAELIKSSKISDMANQLFARLGKMMMIGHGASQSASRRFRYLLISMGVIFFLQLLTLFYHSNHVDEAPFPLLITTILAGFGIALLFALNSLGSGPNSAQSNIDAVYREVVGVAGGR